MPEPRYLTARQAAEALGVSLPTVYAYVSRGWLRSEATGSSRRDRRYRAEDVQRLRERQEQRRHPEQAVPRSLHWGTPILESALTLIAEGRLYYRGHDALALAERASFEAVAALLWTGKLDTTGIFDGEPSPLPGRAAALLPQLADLAPIERGQALLPIAAAEDLAGYDRRPAVVAQIGARSLRWLAQMITLREPGAAGLADSLAQAWAPRQSRAPALLNQALVLCADHELNVSSFTARCAASAGATPYAVISAGLAALTGVHHGGHTERVEALFAEARTPAGVRPALRRWLKQGQAGVPGFGHRLYPEGDPRAAALLARVYAARPRAPATALAQALANEAAEVNGERPTIDFALVALARALDLPPGAALALFALGRTAGWIGHAIEQYAAGQMIRPRARYVGEVPGSEA